MPALQNVLDRILFTPGNLVVVAAVLFILHFLVRWDSARQRVKKLGQKAPAVAYWAPFGKIILSVSSHAPYLDLLLMLVSRY